MKTDHCALREPSSPYLISALCVLIKAYFTIYLFMEMICFLEMSNSLYHNTYKGKYRYLIEILSKLMND